MKFSRCDQDAIWEEAQLRMSGVAVCIIASLVMFGCAILVIFSRRHAEIIVGNTGSALADTSAMLQERVK